jgi:protocatechuate 3,4-dioxygenase beta subunit
MPSRSLLVAVLLAVVGGVVFFLLWSGPNEPGPNAPDRGPGGSESLAERGATAAEKAAEQVGERDVDRTNRTALDGGIQPPGGRLAGIVLDEATRQPIAEVTVRAMREPPGIERLLSRFRGSFFEGNGFWTGNARPPRLLGQDQTEANGRFELLGVEPGPVFLEARGLFTYARSPLQVRVARGEVREGLELFASPAGAIRGRVLDAAGQPQVGAIVSLRPGVNAFLGQLTQRKFGWIEEVTNDAGEFLLAGVPPGTGYVLSAAGDGVALEDRYGIDVRVGQMATVDIVVHEGATIAGQVIDPTGQPYAGANVAMVYLDVSRVLFSADGRDEPITTDAEGRFRLNHVAAGRVGIIAAIDGYAPSDIAELTLVDGGVYDDLRLTLGDGAVVSGVVVDDREQPVVGATVEVRPFEQPRDPDVLKLALRVRNVTAETDASGRFSARGVDSERIFLQVSKPGFVTEVRFNVKTAEEQRVVMSRGVTIRGKVIDAEDRPIARFEVNTRSRAVRPSSEEGATTTEGEDAPRRRGPPWANGRADRSGSVSLRAGQRFGDQMFGGGWNDFYAADGTFELTGLPPGKIRVRVRADGYSDPESQEIELVAGASSEVLTFRAQPGAIARGVVVEAGSLQPVPNAEVTAYRARGGDDDGGGRGMFQVNFDPEDFDFLGVGQGGRRRARTDSEGRFEVDGLAAGKYRFTARHPDLAKASAKEVEIAQAAPTEGISIELDSGGAIEGRVTGAGGAPLRDSLVVAASLQAGAFRSASTDESGNYRIDALTPGQYIVFKSKIDERATNLGYDLLGNMRLKTVTVRRGRDTHLDIQDESEGSVRVFGVVRDGGEPVKRAMVTALGTDRDGLFGMGIRAQPTDAQGGYQLIGLSPGTYFFQVTRFAGQPQQANLEVEVPEGVRELRVDLDLPQSYIAGRVVDSAGLPVARVQVSAGVIDSDAESAPGLLGIIMKNGVAQARTDEAGNFKLNSMAAGRYRLIASGRRNGPGGRGNNPADAAGGAPNPEVVYGQGSLDDVAVDGITGIDGLILTLPKAGSIRGTVRDGSGMPLAGAELVASREGQDSSLGAEQQIMDLFGVQARPVRSDAQGQFTINGLTPGTYRVRADAEGLAPGVSEDVIVGEESSVEVAITVIRGATLRLRARNVDGSKIPLGWISVLDGRGKPIASRVSTMSILRRAMGAGMSKVEDSGWYEVGNVPPDTYTIVIAEPGKPEIRYSQEIRDGEKVEWDIDAAAELEAAGRGKE